MTTAVFFDGSSNVNANMNLFNFCDFSHCSGECVIIAKTAGKGLNNTFFCCNFSQLEDKVAYLEDADGTRFINCYMEDIDETEASDICAIEVSTGLTNAGLAVIGNHLGGTRNNCTKFFKIDNSALPRIEYRNSFVAATFVDMTVATLTSTAHNTFYYFNNTNAVTGTYTVEGTGTVTYYKDKDTSIQTLTDSDTTPNVDNLTYCQTGTTGITITRFDNGFVGQELTIISKGAIVFDTSSANRLIGSSVDITTASGDVTLWICETSGTTSSVWRLKGFVDVSADNSGGA
jgi:hypothetical protein